MRLAVHTDQAYRRDAGGISTARGFVAFLGAIGEHCDTLVIVGRLVAESGRDAHPLPAGARFVALPHGGASHSASAIIRALVGSCRTFWRALDDVDTVWLLGPGALSLPFAALAAVRRRRVVLGVRQDLPAYARARHPHRRAVQLVARTLDAAFRLLGRRRSVIAVGPLLAASYGGPPAVHETWVSLIPAAAVCDRSRAAARCATPVRRLLTVTRLDAEKNPLLLADVLAGLDEDWTLTICGDGPLRARLERRLAALGLTHRVTFTGELACDSLLARYGASDALVHVSLTEGLPQVLLEAFACGTPVVATAVGGVAQAAAGAAILVPPADAGALCDALRRLDADPALRRRLVAAGLRTARAHTLEGEAAAAAAFLAGARVAAAAA